MAQGTSEWLLGGDVDARFAGAFDDVVALARQAGSGRRVAPTARNADTGAGHAAVQRRAADGGAVDSLEREADRVAADVARGPCCAECPPTRGTGNAPPVQRAADAAAPTATASEAPRPPSSGEPLAAPVRDRIEPVLGVDLGHVRVHTDPQARSVARDLHAHAFTAGRDIWLGPGRRADDVELMAHEATHVVQQGAAAASPRIERRAIGAGVQRQAAPATTTTAAPTATPAPTTPAAALAAQSDASPCAVEAETLSNEGLLFQLNRARAYLHLHERGVDRFYDYANLLRRLSTERRRRVAAGHVWLAEPALLHIPDTLYGLVPTGPLAVAVLEIAGAQQIGPAPRGFHSVVTYGQLQKFMAMRNVPVVDPREYFARQDPAAPQPMTISLPAEHRPGISVAPLGAGAAPYRLDMPGTSPFGLGPPNASPLGLGGPAFLPWPFSLPALGGPASPMSPSSLLGAPAPGPDRLVSAAEQLQSLNRTPRDVVSGGPEMVYLPPQSSAPSTPYAPYSPVTPFGMQPNPLAGGSALSFLGEPPLPLPSSATGILWEGSHVTDFAVIDGQLVTGGFRSSLVRHGAADLERSLIRGGGSAAASLNRGTPGTYANDALFPYFPESVAIYRANGTPVDAAELLSMMVEAERTMQGATYRFSTPPRDTAGARSTPSAGELAYQRAFGNQPPGFCPPGAQNCINLPMELHNQALGGEHMVIVGEGGPISLAAPENATAANMRRLLAQPDSFFTERGLVRVPIGRRMLGGAGFAGLLGAGTAVAGDALSGAPDPHYARDAAIGFGSGTTSVFLENYASNALTRQLASSGMSAVSASRLGRLGGGTGSAVVIAPIVTGLTMAFDDQKYTGIDYAARMTRSGVSAGVAAGGGALAAGAVGALAGSEVPIAGNIVGFFVGIGIYYLTDRAIGDEVEDAVRSGLGEYGCTSGVGPGR